jgi:hypothetical protein
MKKYEEKIKERNMIKDRKGINDAEIKKQSEELAKVETEIWKIETDMKAKTRR